jgi:hypothetical protein
MGNWGIVMLVTNLKYAVGHDCCRIALFATILYSSLAIFRLQVTKTGVRSEDRKSGLRYCVK